MQPPVMPEDAHTTRVTSGGEAISSGAGKDSPAAEPIWDDEDTRPFYGCLPDLRAFVPAVLLGETELTNSEQSVKSQDQPTEIVPESDKGQLASYGSGCFTAEGQIWMLYCEASGLCELGPYRSIDCIIMLSKFKFKSEKTCEGFVQCTEDISGTSTILLTHGCHTLNLYEGYLYYSLADVGGGVQLLNK